MVEASKPEREAQSMFLRLGGWRVVVVGVGAIVSASMRAFMCVQMRARPHFVGVCTQPCELDAY